MSANVLSLGDLDERLAFIPAGELISQTPGARRRVPGADFSPKQNAGLKNAQNLAKN